MLEQRRMISIYKKKTGKLIETRSEHRTLIHCNWGWGTDYDGYYTPGVFDQPHPVLRGASLYSRPEKDSSYFKYKLTCIRGIRP